MKDASALELIRIGAWTTVGALAIYIIPGLIAALFMPRREPVLEVKKSPCGCGK